MMIMRKGVSLFVLLVLVAGLAAPSHRILAQTSGGAKPADTLDERIRRVENGLLGPVLIKGETAMPMKLEDRMKKYNVPGVSVAVINNGAIEWSRSYGVAEAGTDRKVALGTLFQAASVSKPVAALGILRLVREGKLKLDEDVNAQLKSWKVPENEFTRDKKVTLRGILSHTAGLTVWGFPGYAAGKELPTVPGILDGKPPANTAAVRVDKAIGEPWRYSGGGFTVAQLLAEDVTGKAFPALMAEKVLKPAGMTQSTYEQPLPERLAPVAATGHRSDGKKIEGKWFVHPEMAAAGLWTTPIDIAKFAIELQREFAGKSKRILDSKLAREMLTAQPGGWGLGIALEGTGSSARFSHGGSNQGFRCMFVAYTQTGQGAVVMTNSDSGSELANELLRSIAKEYNWPDYLPKEKIIAQVDPAVYDSYAGEYQLTPTATFKIVRRENKLIAQTGDGEEMELLPESETDFFIRSSGARVSFSRDGEGRVAGFTYRAGSIQLPAKKIR